MKNWNFFVLFCFFFFLEIVSSRDDLSLLNFYFFCENRLFKRKFLIFFLPKSYLQKTISHLKNGILEIVSWKDDLFFIIFLKCHKSSFEEIILKEKISLFPIWQKL